MSWSYPIPKNQNPDGGATAVAVADFPGAADEAFEAAREQIERNNLNGLDQAEHAKEIAKQLVASGLYGRGTVRAFLSGHGNPEHKPHPDWANDQVTISVNCADAKS